MISDVPGYTWGTVTAMAHAGIRYFNTAPNYFDRIGTILREWENKPFWWVGPDGQSKVLVWIPFWGYAHVARLSRPIAPAGERVLRRPGETRLSLRHRARPLERSRRQRHPRPGDLRLREGLEREICVAHGSSSPA
ncbi:MAG: hypothetical protein V9H26_08490 [Verrucomicrobiota bacterium]